MFCIGVTYGFRSHFLPGRGTSTYGTAVASSSEAPVYLSPCNHLARMIGCCGKRTRSNLRGALDQTPRVPCICQTCAAALGLKRHSVKHLTGATAQWGNTLTRAAFGGRA